ncbi:hypothetical protein BDW71DRAFT_211800 [Aspergillus fruticulosus]
MTSKQERDKDQPSCLGIRFEGTSRDQGELLGPATETVERPQHEPLCGSKRLPLCKPECAAFFNSLKNAYWGDFGVTPLESGPRDPNMIGLQYPGIRSAEASMIFARLKARLGLVESARMYTDMVEDGISRGMTGEKAGIFACRKLIFELGKINNAGDQSKLRSLSSGNDDIFQYFDHFVSLALGWNKLLDTIGAPEVLLINFAGGEENPITTPRVWSKEWDKYEGNCPLLELLSPEYGLKETCLRLSGVVDMIKRLNGLEQSELRSFLVAEIEKRVCDVLGGPDIHASADTRIEYWQYGDVEEDDDTDDDDDSMPDAEQTPSNDSMCIFFW